MKSWEYIIQTRKEHIDFINKIGLIKIITNSYFTDDIDKVIERLRAKDIHIEILEKREWLGIL